MRHGKLFLGLFAAALLAAGGCSGQKGPATEAIAAAESTLSTIRDDAAKYLPSALQGVESTLASLKDSLATRDYRAVLDGAPALTASLDKLKSDVAGKVAEVKAAEAEWVTLSAEVPKLVGTVEGRIAELSKSGRLPRGVNRAALASAKDGLELIKSSWNSATATSSAGNTVDAVTIARGVKTKGEEILVSLGASAG